MNTDHIKSLMVELNTKKTTLRDEMNKVQGAINALQNICEHDWDCVGHDSHKDHYICKICGATENY
jgi:hypothetical protein